MSEIKVQPIISFKLDATWGSWLKYQLEKEGEKSPLLYRVQEYIQDQGMLGTPSTSLLMGFTPRQWDFCLVTGVMPRA